jgi:hypothetical protein
MITSTEISMNKNVLITLGVLLFTSSVTPAMAQQTNTSNSSGANNVNSLGVRSFPRSPGSNTNNSPGSPSNNGGSVSGYNSKVINQSQQIFNDLKAAEQAYQKAEQQANQQGIRRFTRQRRCNCTNPETAGLEEAKARANAFLESIKNPTSEMLEQQVSGSTQSW